jgi:hypothetical protein
MNHQLWKSVGTRVIALAFVIAGVAACHDRISDVSSGTPAATAATPSSQVVGTAPAQPSGDPPGTTPVASHTSDVTKAEESNSKPQEGDDHSYSSVAPNNPQKSDGSNPQEKDGRSTK